MLQEKGIMSQDEKSYLLDLWEELTGLDATQDSYYDEDITWWLQLSYATNQLLAQKYHYLVQKLEK